MTPPNKKARNSPKVKSLSELSVFYPAYNESERIQKTLQKTYKYIAKAAKKYEVVVIDDGSSDDTSDVVRRIQKDYPNLRLINHKQNKGYGEALKTGFYQTKYEWIVFTDSDGQFDFSEIYNFIETQQATNADLVIGYYKHRAVPFIRKFNTWAWQQLVNLLFGLNVRDIDCAFKLINRKVIDKIDKLESGRGAFISSEFLIKAQKANFKIVEIPVTHYPREGGQGTGANLDVIIQSFIDLFKLWRKL